jgi:hypothetical protein
LIADLVFVNYNANNQVSEIIVGEIKRSGGTALTHGQEVGKAGVGGNLSVKSGKPADFDGAAIPVNMQLQAGASYTQAKFIEVRGNGAGGYVKGGVN